jgi:putative addiction module component (TIGR02574 family)
MTLAEVSKLSLREKLQVMEAIWMDLREHIEVMEIPESHRRLLDERRTRVAVGTSTLLNWDQVKSNIGRA